jgi:hypothetical protein
MRTDQENDKNHRDGFTLGPLIAASGTYQDRREFVCERSRLHQSSPANTGIRSDCSGHSLSGQGGG